MHATIYVCIHASTYSTVRLPLASRVMCLATLPRDLLFLVVAAVAATGEECDVAALRAVAHLLAANKALWDNVSAADMWREVARRFLNPLLPFLAEWKEFSLADLQRVVGKLHRAQSFPHPSRAQRWVPGHWDYGGRQCEGWGSLKDGCEYAEHTFEIKSCKWYLRRAQIKWLCTHSTSVDAETRNRWVHEWVNLVRYHHDGRRFRWLAEGDPGLLSPCEYTFDMRHNGLLVVLQRAKLLDPPVPATVAPADSAPTPGVAVAMEDEAANEPPLVQKAWGLLKDPMLIPRVAVGCSSCCHSSPEE